MADDVIRVLVGRQDTLIGSFYLSFAELCLKDGMFRPDDWGWIEGMADWEALEPVVSYARRLVGKKRPATSAQRNCLRNRGFNPWKGISNREASAAIGSSCESRLAPPGWWIGDPISEEQIERLQEMGIEFERPKATPKQAAYLRYMGIENAEQLTAVAASELIDNLFEGLSNDSQERLNDKRNDWRLERYIKHPDIYAKELSAHLEGILVEREELLHQYVRSRLFEGSEKLTKKKIRRTMDNLQYERPEWWYSANSKEVFFQRLAELFPSCVNGDKRI